MHEYIELFLSLQIGVRLSILLIVPLMMWGMFGRFLLTIISVIPYLLGRIILVIYLLIETPISALHKTFGSAFSGIDQGLANRFDKLYANIEKCYRILHKPQKTYGGTAFLLYIIVSIYLIIPSIIGLNEKPFAFWQGFYLNTEQKIVESLTEKGWFD